MYFIHILHIQDLSYILYIFGCHEEDSIIYAMIIEYNILSPTMYIWLTNVENNVNRNVENNVNRNFDNEVNLNSSISMKFLVE